MASPAKGPCFRKSASAGLSAAVLKKLQRHLWGLFAKKYLAEKWYDSSEDRHRIKLVPDAEIRHRQVVRALDALRVIPRDSKTARSPKVPIIGCKLQNGKQGWAYVEYGVGRPISVEKTACMFERVVLGSGAPAVTYPWKTPTGRDRLGP